MKTFELRVRTKLFLASMFYDKNLPILYCLLSENNTKALKLKINLSKFSQTYKRLFDYNVNLLKVVRIKQFLFNIKTETDRTKYCLDARHKTFL